MRYQENRAVIFVVGFSEDHEDLIFDKDQWISKKMAKSDGKRQNVNSALADQ